MKMKKMVAILIVLCMVLTTSFIAFASQEESFITSQRREEAQAELDALVPNEVMEQQKTKHSNDIWNYEVSEYLTIEKLSEKTESELGTLGYDASEISIIKNYQDVYDSQIRTLAKLDTNVLESFNYTEEQINIIKNYQGNKSELARLGATCSVTVEIDQCLYNSSTDRTSSRITTSFVWNGVPLLKMTDALMTGWNEWYLAGKTANIKYTSVSNGTTKWQIPSFVTAANGGTSLGCGYHFPSAIDDNSYYASEGYEIFTVDATGKKDMFAYGLYADRTVSATPSISFSLSGTSVGISVDKTEKEYKGFAQRRVE